MAIAIRPDAGQSDGRLLTEMNSAAIPSMTPRLATLALLLGAAVCAGAKPPRTPNVPPAAMTQFGPVYDVGQMTRLPIARFQTNPVYPKDLREAGIEGEAVVEMIVGTNGDVAGLRIVRATNKEFAAAAALAVVKWKFRPGEIDGIPVNTRMQVPIVFKLNPPAGAEPAGARH